MAEQSTSAAKELWTDGVEDYLKYAKQLLTDFKDVLEGGSKPEAPAAAPAAGGFGFGFGSSAGAAAAAQAPAGGSAKPPLAPGGLFGAGAGSGSQGAAAPASIFAPLPTTGGAFTLGTSGAGGGFGGSTPGSAANSAGGSLFNVPSTGTLGSSFGTAATGADDDEGDEEAEQQPAEPSVRLAGWVAGGAVGCLCAAAPTCIAKRAQRIVCSRQCLHHAGACCLLVRAACTHQGTRCRGGEDES